MTPIPSNLRIEPYNHPEYPNPLHRVLFTMDSIPYGVNWKTLKDAETAKAAIASGEFTFDEEYHKKLLQDGVGRGF